MMLVTGAAGHAGGAVVSQVGVTRLRRGRNGPVVAATRFILLLPADAYAMRLCKQGRT
jgi:uncharacterized protein YbjT (DUF2867 family)